MESLKRTDTNTPLGELANYNIRSTAVPVNPTDSSGQIPTFSATVTDFDGDPKALVGTDVSLRDWTGFYYYTQESGEVTRGRVTSVSKAQSPLTQIDASTIFEKLNTEQTTLPIMQGDTLTYPAYEALEHWCLMAGVPKYSVEGNLKHYISSTSSIGYMADSVYKWRYYGPPTTYRSYVTTEGSLGAYAPTIDVNLSQGITFGALIDSQVSEYRVQAFLPHLQQNVIYTIRRNDTAWALLEKIGSGATTTLKTWTQAPLYNQPVCFLVKVDANVADSTKVDVQFRLLEYNYTTQQSVYTDSTVSSVVSTLRNRPKPFTMDLGYDAALISGKTYIAPSVAFMTEDATLQENYPQWQINLSLFTDYPAPAAELAKFPDFVPGFTGNVWDKIREFCSILDVDIYFSQDSINFRSRASLRTPTGGSGFYPSRTMKKSGLVEKMQDRETARSVEVNYYERLPGADNFDVMWKADSVYSLEKGETKVEVVQTNNSFIFLNQPVPVSGVPVPYTSAFGSYVITGNDGYIVDPQWWKDNGGSITVNTTGVSGEIQITMQAPTIDTVRAPYRVSEGVADRPALYIVGYGLPLKEPVPQKIYTGNPRSAQDVGITLDSKFITKQLMAWNIGHKLAAEYGSGEASITFVESRADYSEPGTSADRFNPLNDSVYHAGSYYRVTDQTITPKSIQVSEAKTYNPISVLNGEFAESKTVGDWNTLHNGKTIANVNVAPLPYYES